jgi:hypothetical protein
MSTKKREALVPVIAFAAVFAVVLIMPPSASAQSQPSIKKAVPAKPWTPPRTPGGQPDLQGVWNSATITPLERPSAVGDKSTLTAEEAAEWESKRLEAINPDRRDAAGQSFNGRPASDLDRAYNAFWYDYGKIVRDKRTSLIEDPPSGRLPPLTIEAEQRAARAEARRGRGPDSYEDLTLSDRCIVRAMPKFPGAYNNFFQIVQTPNYVLIVQEMIHETRIVPLDGRPHLPKNISGWQGDSRGHWEGDTLVIETTNFNDKLRFMGSTENLKIVERLTRTDAETIEFRVTVSDPGTWATPWTAMFPLIATDEKMYEYACHEGNYAMAGILGGQRAQERALESESKK